MNKLIKLLKSIKNYISCRLNIYDVNIWLWIWNCPIGYSKTYYDSWIRQFNIGLICISWRSAPTTKGINKFE